MVNQADIDRLIAQIPAIPAILKTCENALASGDLAKAASVANNDLALVGYMRSIINKPIFGFKKEIKDISQIFSTLGVDETINILYSYYVLLTTPKKWQIFDMDTHKFANLQANFIFDWTKILKKISVNDKEILKSITLIPASICLCEKIFEADIENLELINQESGASYSEILRRQSGLDIFELCCKVAQKWQLSPVIIDIFSRLGKKDKQSKITTYMNLLISYELSRAEFQSAGFAELFEFDMKPSEDEIETFMRALEYEA
ncbi:HDOD domain-containing protein [Campylobacter sp.]|uniref:HDOD domain-containing protein n=1 Tax=Campylobacter sp. TaxID=205 RepID=UPI00270160A6|nr:HDOD domain-containing protein [Campylobacter sp.]